MTHYQLRSICPKLSEERAGVIAPLLNDVCPKYGIDTPKKLAMFIAQAAHESAEFTVKEENLNYSAERLVLVWPKRFPTVASAEHYAHNAVILANHIYADRMGNVPEVSGDGYRYRGSGFIQLTGRENYTEYARCKAVSVTEVAQHVQSEDLWALDSAAWFFAVKAKLLDDAERGDIEAVTRGVNGPKMLGLPSRKEYYQRSLSALK